MRERELIKLYEAGERDFSRADLLGADLRETNLSGANLYWADLREADLSRSDLTDADLRWANLSRASLVGAKVTDEQLAQVYSLKGTTMPDGKVHS